MKTVFFKVAISTICVGAISFGSWKAYTSNSKMGTDLLLKENIEAVGRNTEVSITLKKCFISEDEEGYANGRVCKEGTNRSVVYSCADADKKKVNPYSATGFCYE